MAYGQCIAHMPNCNIAMLQFEIKIMAAVMMTMAVQLYMVYGMANVAAVF